MVLPCIAATLDHKAATINRSCPSSALHSPKKSIFENGRRFPRFTAHVIHLGFSPNLVAFNSLSSPVDLLSSALLNCRANQRRQWFELRHRPTSTGISKPPSTPATKLGPPGEWMCLRSIFFEENAPGLACRCNVCCSCKTIAPAFYS